MLILIQWSLLSHAKKLLKCVLVCAACALALEMCRCGLRIVYRGLQSHGRQSEGSACLVLLLYHGGTNRELVIVVVTIPETWSLQLTVQCSPLVTFM